MSPNPEDALKYGYDFGDWIQHRMEMAAGTYDLVITTSGGEVTQIDPLPVSFAGGEIVSAFAVGGAANQPLGVFALPAGAPGTLLPLLEYGAEFSPWADEMSGYLGQMVEYSLTLSNTGNVTDMFDLEPSGNNWEVHLPVTTTTQGAGEMAEVIVHVTVPLDAMHGDIDSVTVTASSQGDPGMQATSMLTTTVMWYSTYLPLIERQANE